MTDSTILVVEDEPDVLELTKHSLELEGFKVLKAMAGREAIEIVEKDKPDIVVLDLILPDISGWEVCRTLRERKNNIPILMLTCRTSQEDKIVGFVTGADDYLAKPFDPRELVLRVKSILKRTKGGSNGMSVPTDLQLDKDHKVIVFRGKKVEGLTKTEFQLLWILCENAPATVQRKDLLTQIWEKSDDAASHALNVHIQRLREKLDPELTKKLKTVSREGYQITD